VRTFLFHAGLASILLFSPIAPGAYAAPDYVLLPNAPYPTRQETDARLDEVTQLLQSQKTDAQYWEYGWGAFDGGTMAWSIAQASHEPDPKDRAADIVQASESLIGLADIIFRPLPALNADSVCAEPLNTQQDRQQCLAAREALLQRSAERAQEPYEILPHLGNLGFNLAAGLIVWRTSGRSQALVTAIPGEIIGEIQLYTTPSQPIADFDQYRLRFSPLLLETERNHTPAAGVMASLRF
jgi:hypothetical protein